MGWKSFFIVIKPVTEFDLPTLMEGLGYDHLVPSGETTFETAIYPHDDTVYIGQYEDCLIICDVVLSSGCLTEEITHEEKFLMKTFPNTEIGAFVLQSTVNFWGYAVLADGQKIRARAGSSDDGTFLDHGSPLSQEFMLLAQSTLEEDGSRIYNLESFPDEPMTEDQMGEDFVFMLTERFFGQRLDSSDDLLFETKFQAYGEQPISSESEVKKAAPPRQDVSQQPLNSPKPWWKFW
jgi:hypothetical protein